MLIRRPPPATLGHMIELNERKLRNKTALIWEDRRLTFGKLADRSRRLASALYRQGCRRQERIGLLSHNRIEQCEAYGASELAGFITSTVNFRLAAPEIAYILNDSAARVLIFEDTFTETIAAVRHLLNTVVLFICIGQAPDWAEDFEAFLASGDPDGPPLRAIEDDIAYLIYTSGTTGKPKGCMLGQREQYRLVGACSADLGVSVVDCTLLAMPMFHVGGKVVQLASHYQGATGILLTRFDADAYLRALADHQITIAHLAPTMIQMLLESPLAGKVDTRHLRVLLYSASAMPVPVLRRAIQVFGKVFQQQYGMTEGAGTSLHRESHEPDGDAIAQRRLGSVGLPFPGVSIRIMGDDGVELPAGQSGEIWIWCEGATRGYWNNSAATIDALPDGWLRTGDLGMLDEDGYLYIVDRKKDMIISGGENIYSREVEEVLYRHPDVKEAAVIGVKDEKWGEAVCAVVVLNPGCDPSEQALIEHCATQLARYKKPKRIIFTDELLKLPSGKINKLHLREKYAAGSTAGARE